MSGFGYRITGDKAERVAVKEALHCTADLVWVHLSSNEAEAQGWLRDEAKLSNYVVDALTAMETRPRCEAFDDGALVNLRGRSREDAGRVGPARFGADLGHQGPRLFGDAQAALRGRRRSKRRSRRDVSSIRAT